MKILSAFLLLTSTCFGQIYSPEINALNQQLDSIDLVKTDLLDRLEKLKLTWIQHEMEKIGYPTNGRAEELINHSAFTLSYNETHEQANWVMHMILTDVTTGNASRT